MSAIALMWVATIKTGNQTAKQLLQFYASHNFGKPGFEFKIDALVAQLETSKSSIQRAHKLLIDKNLIIKETSFCKNGRQKNNIIYLNIPTEFVDKFMGGGCHTDTPRGVTLTPSYIEYNNKLNNKEQRAARGVAHKKITSKKCLSKNITKSRSRTGALKIRIPDKNIYADVTNQSNSFNPEVLKTKSAATADKFHIPWKKRVRDQLLNKS